MMNLILWIVFGAVVGWIASIIMGTNNQQGGFANVMVGILGALIGGFVAKAFGAEGVSGFNVTGFIVALGGAIILIAAVKLFNRNRTTS